MTKKDLWSGLPVQVICGTGPFGSGKTVFGVSIDPGPQTLVYDNEGSSTIYKSIGFEHIDMAATIIQWLANRRQTRNPTPIDRWIWWRDHSLEMARSGKYTVLMVDPFSEIEAGLSQYVEKNPSEFGYTSSQFTKSGGLYWGAVKDALKAHLDNLRSLVETVYLVTHLRDEYKGNTPTGKREPKGKETLFELASLYLWFERKADAKGNVPAAPSATVLKSRLSHTRFNPATGDMEILPILPPRLPKATPFEIRKYIATPPDYSKLSDAEKVHEEGMTEDERLLIQARISENQKDTAQAELAKADRLRQAMEQSAAGHVAPITPDRSAEFAQAREARTAAAAEPLAPAMLAEIRDSLKTSGLGADWLKAELAEIGVNGVRELTIDQATDLLIKIHETTHRRREATSQPMSPAAKEIVDHMLPTSGDRPATQPAEQPAAQPHPAADQQTIEQATIPSPPQGAELVTDEQLKVMMDLAERTAWKPAKQKEFLKRHGVNSFRNITKADADKLIAKLSQTVEQFAATATVESTAGVPGN